MNETRRLRLEKQILRLLAEITYRRLKHPDIGFVTYTRCEMSEDGSMAKVYVSIMNDDEVKPSLNGLKQSAGFIRSLVGKNLGLRNSPRIVFVLDESLKNADRVDQLIDQSDPDRSPEDSDNS